MLAVWQFVLALAAGAGALALWLYATGRLAGAKDADVASRQAQVEKRLEDGGRRISDLTGKMMILPTTMAQIREELTELRVDSSRINEHVSDLRVDVARMQERLGASGRIK